MRKFIVGLASVLAVFAMACGNSTTGNGGFSTDLPQGVVTSRKLEKSGPSGKFYEVCVKSEVSTQGWEVNGVYCKGERPEKEVRKCTEGARWPTCRNKK